MAGNQEVKEILNKNISYWKCYCDDCRVGVRDCLVHFVCDGIVRFLTGRGNESCGLTLIQKKEKVSKS